MYVQSFVCFVSLSMFLSDSNAAEISETLSEIKRALAKLSAENTELKSEIRDLKAKNNRVSETLMDTRLRLYRVEEFCSKNDDDLPDRNRRIIPPTTQHTSTTSPSNGNELPNLFHQMENVLIQLKDRVTGLEHDLSQLKHENLTLFSENSNLKLQSQFLESALRNVNLKLGSQATSIADHELTLLETKWELDNLVTNVEVNVTKMVENRFNMVIQKISQLTQQSQSLESALQNVDRKLGSQTTSIAEHETKLSETKHKLDNLVTSVQTNLTKEVENHFNTLNQNISQLTQQSQSLESALQNVDQKLGLQATSIAAHGARLSETKRELYNLVSSVTNGIDNRVNTLQLDISRLTKTVQNIAAQQRAPNTQNIAFHAKKRTWQEPMAIHEILDFEETVLNIGGGWNPQSCVFTTPMSGLYFFSSNIMTLRGEDVEVELVKGGVGVSKIYVGDTVTWSVGTLSTLINLSAGDLVWIRIYNNTGVNNGNIRVSDGGWSWFTGFLI